MFKKTNDKRLESGLKFSIIGVQNNFGSTALKIVDKYAADNNNNSNCPCCRRRIPEGEIRRCHRGEGYQAREAADQGPEVQPADGQRSRLHRRLAQLLYQKRHRRFHRYVYTVDLSCFKTTQLHGYTVARAIGRT